MQGNDIFNVVDRADDQEIETMIKNLRVLARSTPECLREVVRLLKERGNKVAVISEGTNDAPSLKDADVGIALGIGGTDVAKAASDCILMDDHLASVYRTMVTCRSTLLNFRRLYQFHLVFVTVTAFTLIIGMCATGDYVMTPA